MAIPTVSFYVSGVSSTATTWTLLVRRASTTDSGATYSVGSEVGSIPLSSIADATAFGALTGRIIVFAGGVTGTST